MISPYDSVDPAPPHPAHMGMSTGEIGAELCDASAPLFGRYRAMFSLRNRGGGEAVRELGTALVDDASSALLRHEVAYVLGQMAHPASVPFLETSLRRGGEHHMVRHEAAEALGAVEDDWERVEGLLKEFAEEDHDVIVRDSCVVALDAADYWNQLGKKDGHGADEEEGEEACEGAEEEKKVDGNAGTDHSSFSVLKTKKASPNVNSRSIHFNVVVN